MHGCTKMNSEIRDETWFCAFLRQKRETKHSKIAPDEGGSTQSNSESSGGQPPVIVESGGGGKSVNKNKNKKSRFCCLHFVYQYC